MFGGVQVPPRPRLGRLNQIRYLCNDKSFYLLNIKTLKWAKLGELPQLEARAYHSATFLQQSGEVAILGGVQFEHSNDDMGMSYGTPSFRHDIQTLHMIKVDLTTRNMQYRVLKFNIHPDDCIQFSDHSALAVDNHLLVYGGRIQQEEQESTTVGNKMFIFDINNCSCKVKNTKDVKFATAGHSMFKISDDCVLLCGGVAKQMLLVTYRDIISDQCALEV